MDVQQFSLESFLTNELIYFYRNFHQYNQEHKIGFSIATSIYDAASKLDICQGQRIRLEVQGKANTDILNGTVILLRDLSDNGVQIILSKAGFLREKDSYSIRGTISHEYTHAEDFFDYADWLGISSSDEVFEQRSLFTMQMRSEYHARRNGFTRVNDYVFGDNWMFDEEQTAEELALFRNAWIQGQKYDELYELMQVCGRYAVLEERNVSGLKNFDQDILCGTAESKKRILFNKIYNFCREHNTIDELMPDVNVLYSLIQ